MNCLHSVLQRQFALENILASVDVVASASQHKADIKPKVKRNHIVSDVQIWHGYQMSFLVDVQYACTCQFELLAV